MNQVMLSVHCGTLLSQVEKFRAFLVSHGYTVFLCNQMLGGVNYRTQICENATYCKVFVAFMNEGWCKSKECEYEFNIAISVNLESPTRTPYIIPILLEPFPVYSAYPAIRGFLRNCNGTSASISEMDERLWNAILAIIRKQIEPASVSSPTASPAPATASPLPVPPAAQTPASTELKNPYAKDVPATGRSKDLPDVRSSPVQKGPLHQSHGSPGPHRAQDSKDLGKLGATALTLIDEIADFRLAGTTSLLTNLSIVRVSLEKTIDPQAESPLRALMDCLCKIKETCNAVQFSASKEFPTSDTSYDIALKLAAILENPALAASLPVKEFIPEATARTFWERNFKATEYSVPWEKFERALLSDGAFRRYVSQEAVMDLRMRIDHYNTGYVVCHRLSDFVGSEPFADVLLKYREQTDPGHKSAAAPDSEVSYPLLLWADDNPDGNEFIIEYAKSHNVNVVLARSTAEAKQWLVRHSSVLDETDLHKFHIITDNVRQGANTSLDLNAGEDLIRFVRGRRCPVPILVYCNDPTYAAYTHKYKNCRVATKGNQCQQFVDELIRAAKK